MADDLSQGLQIGIETVPRRLSAGRWGTPPIMKAGRPLAIRIIIVFIVDRSGGDILEQEARKKPGRSRHAAQHTRGQGAVPCWQAMQFGGVPAQ